MKKDINLDEILNSIAIEKAPEDLIYKWKVEVRLQKERKPVVLMLLRPSIVFPLLFAGFWYYIAVFKKELFEYYILDKMRSFFLALSPVLSDSTSTITASNYYLIGAGIFSVMLATISLFWFYQGKKLGYSRVRI
jgi:hypothetical protein